MSEVFHGFFLRCCSVFIKCLGIWSGTPHHHQPTPCGMLAMMIIRRLINQPMALSVCSDELYLSGILLIAMLGNLSWK